MEAIGTIASVSQLTKYIFRGISTFHETCHRIRSRPAELQQRLDHIDRLYTTVHEIRTISSLRRPDIVQQLDGLSATLDRLIQLISNLILLQHRRFLRRALSAWFRDTETARLESLLAEAEAEKTSLILSLISAQASTQSEHGLAVCESTSVITYTVACCQ